MFLNANIFSKVNFNCSNLKDMRNLQEQVEKSILLPNIVLNFSLFEQIFLVIPKFLQIFFLILEQFFLKVGQNNFGNKLPFLTFSAELCKYNERSGQSKTRMGKLWLNGAAKFLTSLTNVRFFTFFKSISTLVYNSSVYFNQRPSLVVLMLIQDLFQVPANPERNGEKIKPLFW